MVTNAFVDWIGSRGRVISDDNLFNNAVMSCGSFGLIQALILAVDPLFQLSCWKSQLDYTQNRDKLNKLDISSFNLDGESIPGI